MALLTETEVRRASRAAPGRSYKTAEAILREARDTTRTSFDVFLSHAMLDSELVLGVKAILEAAGQSVYVDWLNDPLLDRTNVTPAAADRLRRRMRQSASLLYIYTANATNSKWMPWELGYFDGYNGNVAILPVVQNSGQTTFKGQEFIGLYPYVDLTGTTLYIHRNGSDYRNLRDWRTSVDKLRPAA